MENDNSGECPTCGDIVSLGEFLQFGGKCSKHGVRKPIGNFDQAAKAAFTQYLSDKTDAICAQLIKKNVLNVDQFKEQFWDEVHEDVAIRNSTADIDPIFKAKMDALILKEVVGVSVRKAS